jgi:hypothetical protein
MSRISHQAWTDVLGAIYLGLMVNALMVATALPLVIVLVTTDPVRSWPLIAVLLPLCAPALVGAFAAFHAHRVGGAAPARAFARGWRAAWRRAVPFAAVMTLFLLVVLVDIRALSSHRFGAVAVPLLVVAAVAIVATSLLGLVAYAEAPRAGLRVVTKACLFLALRRWYLTAASLLVLDVQFLAFANHPAIGLGLTAAPALYVVWAGSRHSLRPALEVPATPIAQQL